MKRYSMATKANGNELGFISKIRYGFPLPSAHKLVLSFLLISVITNIIFTITGIRMMANRIVAETQDRIRNDLNAAREIYSGEARHIDDVVRLNARRPLIQDALLSGDQTEINSDLVNVKESEALDFLTLTDENGNVIMRTNYPYNLGDNLAQDEVIKSVMNTKETVTTTTILPEGVLQSESPVLAEKARFNIVDTPMARPTTKTEETSGMAIVSASPVFDPSQNLIGILYGGLLLNRNYDLVDKVKQTVFQNLVYKSKDIGTATIFQDDVRISTNVLNTIGARAVGTRIAEDVYNQVVIQGEPWTGRAYVVNDWYITAYEPIRNVSGDGIGILYVGILEQKYLDIRNQAIFAFVIISALVVLFSIGLSYVLSRSISVPVHRLVIASKELSNGNLDAKVEKTSNDEIGLLADAYNSMANSLRERDEQLKEFTRKKFMESERLALIGQLAANVAHELNNPLQGIVTYSHLLLERNSLKRIIQFM